MKHTLVALAALAIVGCTKNVHFQDYSPKDAGFTVSLPVSPAESSQDRTTPMGPVTAHDLSAEYDEVQYGVTYMRLPNELVREIEKRPQLLDLLRESLIASFKGRAIGQRDIKSSSYPSVDGQEFTVGLPGDKRNVITRIFVSGDMLYEVHVVVPKDPSHRQDIYPKQFLDSFRLTAS